LDYKRKKNMARKLVHDYEFEVTQNKVTINYVYKPERILLINNSTRGKTIFSFNDATLGYTNIGYDYTNEKTIITLVFDCSEFSNNDKLQIFVETDSVSFDPDQAFVDPVSKFRVSQPENLIDTDFEYGLQSTKWETLELVKNIPTFFSRSGDEAFIISSVLSTASSDTISITTETPHELLTGSPIIISGTKSITADGAYVVTTIVDTVTFLYKAKAIQPFTGDIKDEYTQVFPGSVYQGTEFDLSAITSIITDDAAQSTLTVNTKYPTLFTPGTSFFLVNSIAKTSVSFDGALVVTENFNAITRVSATTLSSDDASGFSIGAVQPYDYTATETVYFVNGVTTTVNIDTDTVTFTSPHGILDNLLWMYVAGEGNANIGGLSSYQGYYIRTLSNTEIYFTSILGGTTRVNLTSEGTNGNVMRSALLRAFRAVSADTGANESITFQTAHGLTENSSIPLMFFNGTMSNLISNASLNIVSTVYYAKTIQSPTSLSFTQTPGGAQLNLTGSTANGLMIKAALLDNANSMYFNDHRLLTNDIILFTIVSGSSTPTGLSNNTYYKVEIVNSNRIRFKDNNTGSVINLTSIGDIAGEYQIQARTPNLNNDGIFIPNNGLTDSSVVIYNNNGNFNIGGLTNNTSYYVFQKTQNYIKLASTISGWAAPAVNVQGINITSDQVTTAISHSFVTGQQVQYIAANPVGGLVNGAWYWVRAITSAICSLHWTKNGAQTALDTVDITTATLSGTHTLRAASIVDITSSSTGTHSLTATQVGASDGVYQLVQNLSDTSFTINSNTQVLSRVIDITGVVDYTNETIYSPGHGFVTGTPVVYNTTGIAINELTNNGTYYAIRISKDWFSLTNTVENARLGFSFNFTTAGTGTHTLTTSSIAGEVTGTGTVTATSGSTKLSGFGTNFNAIYSPGDLFRLNIPETVRQITVQSVDPASNVFSASLHGLTTGQSVRMAAVAAPGGTVNGRIYFARIAGMITPESQFTLHPTSVDASTGTNTINITTAGSAIVVQRITDVGQTFESIIQYVNSKVELVLYDPIPSAVTDTTFSVGTGIFVRADGSALHRPYDGGVELVPSQNPDSQMIRQTRKYFRYQSGKGIQVSFAVNFSPTTSIDVLEVFEDTNKVTKCRRDIGYFIDGVGFDVALGTNYNGVFLGIAESNSLDISPRVIQAIEDTRDTLLTFEDVDSSTIASTRVTAFFNEILNIIENDRTVASPLTFTNPTNATVSRIAAKDKILSNLIFLEEEVNAWVALNFPNYDHDVTKCSRDVKYAVWAAAYDILYGGNSATYDSAKFFLYSYADGAFGILPQHIEQTVSAYARLKQIISDVAQGILITKTAGNNEIQIRTGNNATADDGAVLTSLIQIVEDTITNGEVPSVTRTVPSITWAIEELQVAKATIDANKITTVLTVVPSSFAFLTARGITRYPHRLTVGTDITVYGATGPSADYYNGVHIITAIPDQYTFTFSLDDVPPETEANGIVEYYVNGWRNSRLKCGLFDDQNGLYFEYDGQSLNCVRRSSVQQISGVASVTFKSGEIIGNRTKFSSQLVAGEKIVIKGQTYIISRILSNTLLYILPSYRGESNANVIITKTIDTKVPQADWSIDPCFGTGSTGFVLDIHKIQMAYMDYSWYGAGKVRFGFKDQTGLVTYVHEFIHNNKFTEAYMRSGNLPARYEIENIGAPSYVPALAHWGTSVIMDGRFDDDKAYVFTANSNTVTLTGTSSITVSARVESRDFFIVLSNNQYRFAGYAISIPTSSATFNNIAPGVVITGAGLQPNTLTALPSDNRISPRQPYLASINSYHSNNFNTIAARNLLFVDRQPTANAATPSDYTVVISGVTVPIVYDIPLISIRLAPSVDNGSPGFLGQREIINRMQLILSQVGILTTHGVEVTLTLNGQITNNSWQRVQNPSLSQLIYHQPGDTISSGTVIFSFRAQGSSGSTARTPVNTVADLGEIATLGNSIMGGDGTFPDGPDLLTIVVKLIEDPSTVGTGNPFSVGGRISWSESQA
jgi:hypothetical protein